MKYTIRSIVCEASSPWSPPPSSTSLLALEPLAWAAAPTALHNSQTSTFKVKDNGTEATCHKSRSRLSSTPWRRGLEVPPGKDEDWPSSPTSETANSCSCRFSSCWSSPILLYLWNQRDLKSKYISISQHGPRNRLLSSDRIFWVHLVLPKDT